jgi:uncharacterized membrane protein
VLNGLRQRLAEVDRAALGLVEEGGWMLAPAGYGAALGAGSWALAHGARMGALAHNALTPAEARAAATWAGIGAAAVLAIYALAVRAARQHDATVAARQVALRLGPRFTPCLALPLLALLRAPRIEAERPALTLLLIALASAAIGRGIHAAPPAPAPPNPLYPRAARAGAVLWVAALWIGYGLHFSWLSITNHHALRTGAADLGYYDNVFYQSIHGRPLGCSFFGPGHHAAAHFDPILVLLSPLYALYSRAELLLVLQSFWLGAGIVPVYLLARARGLARDAAGALALAYALYPALHGANLYDFHSLSLLPTLALWLLHCAEAGRRRAFGIVLALALLCREDVALVLCPVGLCFLLDRRPGKARLGWATIAAAGAYFVVVKRFFMTSSAILNTGPDTKSYEHYYADLIPYQDGVRGILRSLAANPAFALAHAVTEPKLTYLALLFLPLLFLPLLARPERGMLVYGALFSLLATHEPLFHIHFQYASLITPFAFAAAIAALAAGRAGDPRRVRALAFTAAIATALAGCKFGGVAANESFRAGVHPVARALDAQQAAAYAWVESAAASIPGEASVAVTQALGPHVSGRREVYFYRDRDDVDYVFADDRELTGDTLAGHRGRLLGGGLVEIARHGAMALYRARR